MRRFIAALFAFALLSAPAMAVPPVFNGDLVSASLPTYNVKFYGAKCDGTTDDSAAIQAAVTAAQGAVTAGTNKGGRILIPGICAVASTVTVTGNNIFLVGNGDGYDLALTPQSGALKWIGSAGGTMLKFAPPGSCVSACTVAGGGVSDMSILSNSGSAAVGIALYSVQGAVFDRISGDQFTESWIETYLAANGGGAMHNHFNRLYWVNETHNGGHGVWIKGGEFNTIDDYLAGYGDGDAVRLGGGSVDTNASDTSDFNTIRNFHGIAPGGYSGFGIVFDCGSWSNEGNHVSDPHIIARGTSTCTGTLARSFADSVRHFDKCDDNLADPTVETGSSMWWDTDCGGKVVSSPVSAQVNFVQQYYSSDIGGTYGYPSSTTHPVFYFGKMNTDNKPIVIGNTFSATGMTTLGSDSTTSCAGVNGKVFTLSNYGGQSLCFDGASFGLSSSGSFVDGTGGFIFTNSDTGSAQTQLTANASNIQGKTCGLLALVSVGHGTYACFDLNGSFVTGGGGFFSLGVKPNGSSGGYTPEYFPLGVAATHPRVVTGTCSVTAPNTACTFPNSFTFADTTFTCPALSIEGATPQSAPTYDTKTTTGITIHLTSSATVDYQCSR